MIREDKIRSLLFIDSWTRRLIMRYSFWLLIAGLSAVSVAWLWSVAVCRTDWTTLVWRTGWTRTGWRTSLTIRSSTTAWSRTPSSRRTSNQSTATRSQTATATPTRPSIWKWNRPTKVHYIIAACLVAVWNSIFFSNYFFSCSMIEMNWKKISINHRTIIENMYIPVSWFLNVKHVI